MNLPEPMLASPMPKGGILRPSEWVAEEKYDGHRLIVTIKNHACDEGIFCDCRTVENPGPSSRISAVSRDGNPRALPRHILESLFRMPEGIYDGELIVPGFRSYGVTEKLNESKLILVLFDVLEFDGHSTTAVPCKCPLHFGFTTPNLNYEERRALLVLALNHAPNVVQGDGPVRLALVEDIQTEADISRIAGTVWDRDGEGLILKKKSGLYNPGKRSRDWIKIKACASAVLTITGFEAGKLGPQSKVRLRDDEGNETTVKTKNDAMRERFRLDPASQIGRRLRIEFQERTPDGSYRHPRFDRFEDE